MALSRTRDTVEPVQGQRFLRFSLQIRLEILNAISTALSHILGQGRQMALFFINPRLRKATFVGDKGQFSVIEVKVVVVAAAWITNKRSRKND